LGGVPPVDAGQEARLEEWEGYEELEELEEDNEELVLGRLGTSSPLRPRGAAPVTARAGVASTSMPS
jgi:hypothetical protein